MTIDDLSKYSYKLPFSLPGVLTVGWIGEGGGAKGKVSEDFHFALRQAVLFKSSDFDVHVNKVRGVYSCNMCGKECFFSKGEENSFPLGMSEVWIPGETKIYAAPSLILHYVTEHMYLPPEEFIYSVMSLDVHSRWQPQAIYDDLVSEQVSKCT